MKVRYNRKEDILVLEVSKAAIDQRRKPGRSSRIFQRTTDLFC